MNNKIEDLIDKVVHWANERSLVCENNMRPQYDYVHKELTELQDAARMKEKFNRLDHKSFGIKGRIGNKLVNCFAYDSFEVMFFDADNVGVKEFMCNEQIRNLIEDEIMDGFGDVLVTLITTSACIGLRPRFYKYNSDLINQSKTLSDALIKLRTLIPSVGSINCIDTISCYLYAISDKFGYDLFECLQRAYNEINGRKGKTIDGQFIKEQSS